MRSSEGEAPASATLAASLSANAFTAPGISGSACLTSACMRSRRSRRIASSLDPPRQRVWLSSANAVPRSPRTSPLAEPPDSVSPPSPPGQPGSSPDQMPAQANQPLPAGYVLNGYRIEKPLSSGGFSIVYLARDDKDTPFAIKEYLPSSLQLRTDGVEVQLGEDADQSVFRHGLKCFFEEGRALAMNQHPNVVRVENFFRANETCYMVMQYVRGRTLQFHIQRHHTELTESFMRRTFISLLNGLRGGHANKLLHLDIK